MMIFTSIIWMLFFIYQINKIGHTQRRFFEIEKIPYPLIKNDEEINKSNSSDVHLSTLHVFCSLYFNLCRKNVTKYDSIRKERSRASRRKSMPLSEKNNNEVKNGSEGRPLFGTALLRLK